MHFKLIFSVYLCSDFDETLPTYFATLYKRVQGINTINKFMLCSLRDLQAGKEENKNGYFEHNLCVLQCSKD